MGKRSARRKELAICFLLVAAVVAVYWQVYDFGFVGLDDQNYISENPAVKAGFSSSTARWAFTTFHMANWHPVTWISLMVDSDVGKALRLFADVELGRGNSGVYHITNVFLHIASTVLLFALLNGMTGKPWRSGFVAALFAVHPIHIESVAWVTERKDVLSTFFWFAVMHSYVRYVRGPTTRRYLGALALFAVGLMSKPMLVSLPFVLLIIDFWPLGRARSGFRNLLVEKVPFLALSAASCVITLVAQQAGGAVGTLTEYPLGVRAANAAVSTAGYLAKMLWPRNLAVIYPHPGNTIPTQQVVGCVALLVAFTVAAFVSARSRPWMIAGWLWYIITLLPVIGLVQVGYHAMADRYAYVPLVGIYIAAAWSLAELSARAGRVAVAVASALGILVVLLLGAAAYRQVGYWSDGVRLFKHDLKVTSQNQFAHFSLATVFHSDGDNQGAIRHLRAALRIDPAYVGARNDLAVVLFEEGRTAEAIAELEEVLRLSPINSRAHTDLGIALIHEKRFDDAIRHFHRALDIDPGSSVAKAGLDEAERLK